MSTDDILKEVVKKIKFAPSRDWANTYLDLMKQVLDITGLKDGNPRLVMPLSKTRHHFPISINSRYVLSSFEEETKLKVCLLFTPDYQDIPKLRNKPFSPFSNGKSKIEPPGFLEFNDIHEVVSLLKSSEQVKQCWHDTLTAEVNRAKGGRHGYGHKSIIYRLVTDKKFRTEILDMAFPESKPIEKLDDYVQYHNSEATGVSCLKFGESNSFGISTSKPVSKLKGNRVWLIGGIGKPRKYYLCYNFLVDKVEPTDGDYKFIVDGQKGILLKPPILLNGFPWFKDFLKKQQNFSFGLRKIDKVFVSELEKITSGQKVESLSGNEAQNAGGGFGNSKNNREVEQAAISFVTNDYKKRGWSVKSVESEKQGFDLLCTKAKIQERVEVKGVQGNLASFIITAGEIKQSRLGENFILYVVTSALSRPQLHKFTGKEFNERFSLEAIAYCASLKQR